MFFAGGSGRGPENVAAYALLFSRSSSVNDMGSLCFAFLQHSGGRRRFLFVVSYYNAKTPGSFLCCERLLFPISGFGEEAQDDAATFFISGQPAKLGAKKVDFLKPVLLGALKISRCYLALSHLPAMPATISAIPGYINAVGRSVSSEMKPVTVGPRK